MDGRNGLNDERNLLLGIGCLFSEAENIKVRKYPFTPSSLVLLALFEKHGSSSQPRIFINKGIWWWLETDIFSFSGL